MPKRRTLQNTIEDLDQVTGDLTKLDRTMLARLSRDKRLSKELQSAARNFPKLLDKFNEVRSTLYKLSHAEKEALIDGGYTDEIDDIVKTIREVLSNIKITYKGVNKYIWDFLEITENTKFGRIAVFFDFNGFEKSGWGYRGQYSRFTQSRLSEEEQDELLSVIRSKIKSSFDVALPQFDDSLGKFRNTRWFTALGYGNAKNGGYGGHWVLQKKDFVKYINL
jgi:hypothetical protein